MRNPAMNYLFRGMTCMGAVIFISCRHEPLPVTFPEHSDSTRPLQPCDPSRIYFVNDVMPCINASCAIPGCHTHDDPTAGIDLSSYDEIMQAKVKGKPIVIPGDPLNSKICRVLYLLDLIPMPPVLNYPLSQQGKDNIVNWVLQGATFDACEPAVDTSEFAYRKDIRPLIDKYCTGCHFGNYASDSVELVNYQQVKRQIDSHTFFETISGAEGFVRMPTGPVTMQPSEIIRIRKWIESGAPNN
jgi:hypothetical protein